MTSLNERNSEEKFIKRTTSLPLKGYPNRSAQNDCFRQPSQHEENSALYSDLFKNLETDAEVLNLNTAQKMGDFLGDRQEVNDLENLLGNISMDQPSTDIDSKDEILSILMKNKKRVYSSNILDSKLFIGNSIKKKLPFYKSNSITGGESGFHEVPERISKPVCNQAQSNCLSRGAAN